MLGTCLFRRNSFIKCVLREAGFKKISELNLCTKYESLHFYCSKLNLPHRQPHLTQRRCNAMRVASVRYNSMPAVEHKKESNSYFEQMFCARKTEAQRSVLLDVKREKDIPCAVAYCEKYGDIKNAFSYSGKSGNSFLLLEFTSESSAQKLISNCKCANISDAFPVCSRLIIYEKKTNLDLSKMKVNEESAFESSVKSGVSVSDFLEDIYHKEKLSELDTRLRYFFCTLIQDSLSGLFPYCDVIPFGSSVNGLGKHGCDLDVMLRLYPKQVNQNSELLFLNKTCVGSHKHFQQKAVSCLRENFQTFFPGISFVKSILHARVPILKMDHRILNISCDLSVNNMSAVYMSDVIRFCGEIDTRIRPLISIVKKWAREADITKSNPGNYITNFGLTNLVMFFLQSRPHPILPPFIDVFHIVGEDNSFNFHVEYLKSIEELKSVASANKESLADLLKEFFSFLATNQFKGHTMCLMSGMQHSRPLIEDALCLPYIFEESLNITKNVSASELRDMCAIASISAKVLESNLKHKVDSSTNLKKLLGIPSNSKMDSKTQKIDVNSIVGDKFPKNRTK